MRRGEWVEFNATLDTIYRSFRRRRWWGGQSCSRVEVRPRYMHSTPVPIRITSGRSWASQFCLQKSPGQVGNAPRPQWLCLSRNPRDKRANRVVPHKRKEARWSNTHPWQSGKSLCLDVTVICTLVESYVTGSARKAVIAAERLAP